MIADDYFPNRERIILARFIENNVEAYRDLLIVELITRELIREELVNQFGNAWQKRLPGDLLKKIRESQKAELRPHFGFVKLGPLYYLTFGELLSILRLSPLNSLVRNFGGEVFIKQFENLSPARNSVCHSRPISASGIAAVSALLLQIEAAVGKGRVATLLESPDIGYFPEDAHIALLPALEAAHETYLSLPPDLPIPPLLEKFVSQYWWGDAALAGFDARPVEDAFAAIRKYNALGSGVGSIGHRQALIEDEAIGALLSAAIAALGGTS